MTDAQEEALNRVQEILREHFDASILAVVGTAVGCDADGKPLEDKNADHEFVFHGGYATAVGLAELIKLKVWKEGTEIS